MGNFTFLNLGNLGKNLWKCSDGNPEMTGLYAFLTPKIISLFTSRALTFKVITSV